MTYLNVTNVETVIKEIEETRNFDICEDDFIVDTIDILKELKHWEMPLRDYYYDGWLAIEDYLEEKLGICGDVKYDNTYNYNAPLSNGIDYRIIDMNAGDGLIYYAVQIHKGGDIRGNYTPWVVFSLTYDDLWEAFDNASKHIEIEFNDKIYDVCVNPHYEGFEVYCDGEYIYTSYEIDIEEIRKEIENL